MRFRGFPVILAFSLAANVAAPVTLRGSRRVSRPKLQAARGPSLWTWMPATSPGRFCMPSW
jgi:hypothetical protein